MSESKHTPGPWSLDKDRHITDVWDSEGYTICEIYKSVAYTEEAQANRTLIAAAPDMLEALECVKEGRLGWEDAVDHAILKAKGKES